MIPSARGDWQRVAGVALATALVLCAAAQPAGDAALQPDEAATAAQETIATADPPPPGGVPSEAFMEQVYAAAQRGGRLYDERRYEEALPHLLLAASYGFKLSQASLGDIYLHGRGSVPRKLATGIGWLGVAAAPTTSKQIDGYFKEALAQLPDEYAGAVDKVVAEFRARYGHHRHRVACHVRGEVLQDLACSFIDHAANASTYADGSVEEVVVTAPIVRTPAPEFGEIPTGSFIAEVYDAANRGSRLYGEGKYKEALPFLVAAAKRGFKWAQASAADIYLHGRGGVAPDLEAGIGWLGVAAKPKTSGSISRFFKESVAKLPPRYTPEIVDRIVANYSNRYANHQHRVACRHSADEGVTWSFYMKRLRCRFIDEATQCRDIVFDGNEVNSQWTCKPLRDTRSIDVRPY